MTTILTKEPDPYLNFAKSKKRQGKHMLAPWTSTNLQLLKLAEDYFPEIPIVASAQLDKPDMTPVQILPLNNLNFDFDGCEEELFIAVGGPPAAAVALQSALNGQKVLYIHDTDCHNKNNFAPPIWAGAGNHGEPDALTEGPAYMAGYYPFRFIGNEILRWLFNAHKNDALLNPDFPWLSLNIGEWLQQPGEWLSGFRVLWGNHQLAKIYLQTIRKGKVSPLLEQLRKRSHDSGTYLENLNHHINKFLRTPRGSLIVAPTQKQWEALQQNALRLREEGLELLSLSPEEAEVKYGFTPRGALGLMEKTHDFIFEPDFLASIEKQIAVLGGQVITNWRLSRVFVDTETKKGGVLEFIELTSQGEKKLHYRKFHHAHLSLGPTPFLPRIYDLISVTGISINALVFGVELCGGPIVCGGSNHIIPLLPPKKISLFNPETQREETVGVTFVRLSAAASVGPLNRGKEWHKYEANHALHLIHRVIKTLPENVSLKILSVRACNRVIGKDGHQVELHPQLLIKNQKISCDRITIQLGAGGGGLTQMGAVPQQMIKEYLDT